MPWGNECRILGFGSGTCRPRTSQTRDNQVVGGHVKDDRGPCHRKRLQKFLKKDGGGKYLVKGRSRGRREEIYRAKYLCKGPFGRDWG